MDKNLLEKFNLVEQKHWWWEGRRKLIQNFIPKKKNLRVLDIGCGTGETLSFVKRIRPNSQVYGIDTMSLAVSYTKSRNHTKAYVASAMKLPFRDNFFDVLLYLDVLEHLKDHHKALMEGKRVLKKGGVMIITCPALPFIISDFDKNQGHVRRYTKNDFLYLENKTGMKLKFLSYFNFIFSIPIIIVRVASKIKYLSFLSNYDNGFNYNIADKSFINNLFRGIFLQEIGLMKHISYPLGISIIAVYKKV